MLTVASVNPYMDRHPLVALELFEKFFTEDIFDKVTKQWTSGGEFPKSQVRVKDDTLTIQLALAGWEPSQLKVEAGEDYVLVQAEKAENSENLFADRGFKWSRRDPYGTWDFKKAKVNSSRGLLTLKVPKREEVKPKRLEIE